MLFSKNQAARAETESGDDWFDARRFAALLAGLALASYPQVWLGLQTFVYRDFGIFSYPIAYHLRESFWHGELPLWNPLNSCGTPFLAQWNTQALYPPALFYLLLPLSWSLGVFCLLHLFWGGMGMFLLAESWVQNRRAAAFAGIAFAFNGVMLNSLIWPATVAGLGWMPWVVWLVERAGREGGRKIFLAAIAGALQMLSGAAEVVMLTWALAGTLTLVEFFRGEFPRKKIVLRAGLVVLLVSGLAAAQLLPFFELLDASRRQQGVSAAVWPMPPTGWANYLVPLFHCHSSQGVFMQAGQSWINSYYAGVATLVLAVIAIWRTGRVRVWLLAGLVGLCLVLALGAATPAYGWLSRHVSAIELMRFPVKFLILPALGLPLLAACALAEKSLGAVCKANRIIFLAICLATVALVLGLVGWQWRTEPPGDDRTIAVFNGLLRAVFFAAIVVVWVLAEKIAGWQPRRLCQLLLLLLLWLDLFWQMPQPQTVNRSIYQPGLPRPFAAAQPGAARVLVQSGARESFYHVALPNVADDYLVRRFALFGDCNLLDGIAKCDGFFPLYLSDHAAFFYNFFNDTAPVGPLLDFLGVAQTLKFQTNGFGWVPRTTFMPLLTGGQKPRFADDLTALHGLTNADFQPRREVYLPPEAKPFITATDAVAVTLSSVRQTDQQIEADVVTPAPTLLVAAQTYYHPWRAYVNGSPVRLWRANYAFQAFEVPAGSSHVKLAYEDRRFYLGAVISLTALAICLAGLFWRPAGQPSK
jgi:hypothetical protein